jgi:uncharacterized protein (TIGR02271 family)
MNKALLLLSTLLLYAAGCSSTRTGSPTSSRGVDDAARIGAARHLEQRVEGQFAREAGLERRGVLGKPLAVAAAGSETQAPSAAYDEGGQGGLGPVQPAITITSEAAGLEIVDQTEIELRKEELVVGKREVSNGGVLIRKVVQTENVSQPVELRREEYVLERVPASQAGRSADPGILNAFQGREIYLPLTREEAISTKRVLLSEGVQYGKRIETDRQIVTAPVRAEDVEIVKNPDLSDPRFSAVPRRPAPGSGLGFVQGAGGPAIQTAAERMQLAREELVVGKAEVDHGGLYLRKIIRTETASQPVELKREEFVMQRTPLGDQPVSGAEFQPREIRLDLSREEAVVGTRNYPTEFVRIRKQVHKDTETVSAAVRKENLEVVKLAGSSAQWGQGGTGIGSEIGTAIANESGSGAESLQDLAISEHVREALANGSLGKKYSVLSVVTREGMVTLRGTVDSEKEKARIGKAVGKLSGVRGVRNELTVRR